MSFYIS